MSSLSTNVTVCFTLPQIMAVARAAMEGVALAQENDVDLGRWRAVITVIVGRLTERQALDEQAARRGIKLSWQDKHWFGIAVFWRAYRLLSEGGDVNKLLACSLRHGPVVDKLAQVPYCTQALDPNGLALEQFNDHPATLYTVDALRGHLGLEYVEKRVELVRR